MFQRDRHNNDNRYRGGNGGGPRRYDGRRDDSRRGGGYNKRRYDGDDRGGGDRSYSKRPRHYDRDEDDDERNINQAKRDIVYLGDRTRVTMGLERELNDLVKTSKNDMDKKLQPTMIETIVAW